MAVNGTVSIYKMTDTTDVENTITDKIEFDGNARVPDGGTGIVSYRVRLKRTETQNSAPLLEESRNPDVGFNGAMYVFNIFFDESVTSSNSIAKLVSWFQDANSVKQKFRQGRFGIRNNYENAFDMLPTNVYGLKFVDFDFEHDIAFNIKRATITLQHSGEATGIGRG